MPKPVKLKDKKVPVSVSMSTEMMERIDDLIAKSGGKPGKRSQWIINACNAFLEAEKKILSASPAQNQKVSAKSTAAKLPKAYIAPVKIHVRRS